MWSYLDIASWLRIDVRIGYPNASIESMSSNPQLLTAHNDVKFGVLLS
jgi:hypothetical protein